MILFLLYIKNKYYDSRNTIVKFEMSVGIEGNGTNSVT